MDLNRIVAIVTCTLLVFLGAGCASESGSGIGFSSGGYYIHATLTTELRSNLFALKNSLGEQVLSQAEYASFRQATFDHFLKSGLPHDSESLCQSANWLRDELSEASTMKSEKLVSEEEFRKIRAHLLELYKP